MKSLLNLALVAIVGLFVCAPVALHAQAATPTQTAATAGAAATKSANKPVPYKGTVKSIDASSIVVTTSKGDVTLVVLPTTKIKIDGKKGEASAIAAGQKVTGSYTKDDTGAMTAYSIHAKTK